ncbi:hypothetical protein J6590_073984 [Homalodisca vitripennis]|nr:hypothetical protein J6590_073984 [Homalodisca vitripennis]
MRHVSVKLHLSDQINCSSLAEQLNGSVLRENEDLRQELFEEKNKSSFYVLELEDKLKEKEDIIESQNKIFEEKENTLLNKIKFLDQKLKKEKEAKEILILQIEEETKANTKNNEIEYGKCNRCTIYEEENARMLVSIRSLEEVIKIMEKDNLDEQNELSHIDLTNSACLHCFPTLNKNKNTQEAVSVPNKWQVVRTPFGHKPQMLNNVNKKVTEPDFTSKNIYEVLQNCTTVDKTDEMECNVDKISKSSCSVSPETVSRNKILKNPASSRHGHKDHSHRTDDQTDKQRVLLCSDSHGRNLTFNLNKCSKSFDAVGFVRPGGRAEQVLNYDNLDGERLGPDDFLVIACGSNDVACNEAERALNLIDNVVNKYSSTKIILVDLPSRYDLKNWSCVNKELRKTNVALETLSKRYPNVTLVKASEADRSLYTRHGMHLNDSGKKWLAGRICDVLIKRTQPEVTITQSTPTSQIPLILSPSDRRESPSNTEQQMLCTYTDSNIDAQVIGRSRPSTSEDKETETSPLNCTLSHPITPT